MINKEFDDIAQMAKSYGLTELQIEEQKRTTGNPKDEDLEINVNLENKQVPN